MTYDEIAQKEFCMDYDQLGPNEKEWVHVQYQYELYEFKSNMSKAFKK